MTQNNILEVAGVSKSYLDVQVLFDIDFDLRPGEVHAIVGGNGAGKSTLIKIISGAHDRSGGEIRFNGEPLEDLTPRKAHDLGIATIYQERNLLPALSIGENILAGNEPTTRLGTVDWKGLYGEADEILGRLHLHLDSRDIVADLGSAEQQAVEIAKALYKKVRVVIMDEPTASLTSAEIDNLFDIVENLKRKNVSVIYISHRLDEVFRIADRITVLRDGRRVLLCETEKTDRDRLIKAIVGEEVAITHIEDKSIGDELLRARGLSRFGAFRDISFDLRRGEILGMAGMVGSGRTAVARALAGIDRTDGGKLELLGEEIQDMPLRNRMEKGICLLPEDRDAVGLISSMSVAGNITIADLRKIGRGPLLDLSRERDIAQSYMSDLDIRARSIHQDVQYLSGGNRQKVMISKWLLKGFEVLVMDEPTTGVDVGAREAIHRVMKDVVAAGKAIIMISSDMDELMNMSHRIVVMRNGSIAATLTTSGTTRKEVVGLGISDPQEGQDVSK